MNANAGVDHGNRREFIDYYLEASASRAAVERSRAIMASVNAVLARHGRTEGEPLHVADIGCGPGAQSAVWLEEGHHVHGLDVSEAFVEEARARLGQSPLAEFELGSATALPWDDASMDVCILPELLEHVAEWESCLQEAARVLKPGGLLFVSTTNTLCPKQCEYKLPLFSWYPGFVKRRFAEIATDTWPWVAGYATYPAVNWFTYPGLLRYISDMGFTVYDRFQLATIRGVSGWKGLLVGAIASSRWTRTPAYFASASSLVIAVKK